MLKSCLAVAFSHLKARRVEALFNVLGLAVGVAGCLLITLFLRYELSYEDGFADADRIYRISRDYHARDGARERVPASANAPVAPALTADFVAVEQAARVFAGGVQLTHEEAMFHEQAVRFADQSLFEVFDFRWTQGSPDSALTRPFTIVLTESLAAKYFGESEAVGRTLTLDNAAPLRVTGVIADLPDSTHLQFDGLISIPTLQAAFGPAILEQWNSMTDFHTYFRLREGAAIEDITGRLPEFLVRHAGDEAAAVSALSVMNVRDIHLRSMRDEEWQTPGSLATVYSFAAIALGILLIACINFVNLSTARAAQRAREVAVRKAVGATRAQLVGQFLGESMLLAMMAMVVAMSMVELLLPAFSGFLGVGLEFDYLSDPALAAALLALTVFVGLVAGSYPAFYLSAFQPARVLRGELTRGRGGKVFRNLLVVFQFSMAIVLLICLTVVYRQTEFVRSMDLGFDKDRIVVLTGSPRAGLGAQWPAFRQQLLAHPGVESVTASHFTPFMFDDNHLRVRQRGQRSFSRIQYMGVDFDFFETYDVDVLAGRGFSRELAGDALTSSRGAAADGVAGVVLNRAAARLLGLSSGAAVGEMVEIGYFDESADLAADVVGVVDDTHFESLREQVRPMLYLLVPSLRLGDNFTMRHASVELADGHALDGILEHIDATWRTFLPDQPVTRRFLDDAFQALYQQEQRQQVLLAAFAVLAIAIACVGLFGLAAFDTERRTREIGVRKALGGSVGGIVMLLTGNFSVLVVAANLLAWPAAWVLMRGWLDNFAYRVDLGPLVFAGASLAALAVAWLTVAGIAARAARANPVHALRYD